MAVVNIEDYRVPEKSGAPCEVTFIGFRFRTPEGQEQGLNVTIRIADGDFTGAIEAVKQQGGFYLGPFGEGEAVTGWFLPWPCAAVRIRAAAR
jgi:hypothetical protein